MSKCLYGLKNEYDELRICYSDCPAYVDVSFMDDIRQSKCGFVNQGVLPIEMKMRSE
jgi:hypothetical protein